MLKGIDGTGDCDGKAVANVTFPTTATVIQAASDQLGLLKDKTIFLDVGSAGGKFCMYGSLLGWSTIGIGKHTSTNTLVHTCICTELMASRWAMSIKCLQGVVKKKLLSDHPPPVHLFNVDANSLYDHESKILQFGKFILSLPAPLGCR